MLCKTSFVGRMAFVYSACLWTSHNNCTHSFSRGYRDSSCTLKIYTQTNLNTCRVVVCTYIWETMESEYLITTSVITPRMERSWARIPLSAVYFHAHVPSTCPLHGVCCTGAPHFRLELTRDLWDQISCIMYTESRHQIIPHTSNLLIPVVK